MQFTIRLDENYTKWEQFWNENSPLKHDVLLCWYQQPNERWCWGELNYVPDTVFKEINHRFVIFHMDSGHVCCSLRVTYNFLFICANESGETKNEKYIRYSSSSSPARLLIKISIELNDSIFSYCRYSYTQQVHSSSSQ